MGLQARGSDSFCLKQGRVGDPKAPHRGHD